MIVGVDGGNNEIKTMGPFGVMKFVSDIGEARDLRLQEQLGPDDMVWEYEGRKGFAGTLARNESEFGGSIMGDTKAHEDGRLRVLLALFRYSTDISYQIVVGQPISQHTPGEKKKFIDLLKGTHRIKVNGLERTIVIRDVNIAAEGGAAFWAMPVVGKIRIIDVGSGTVNFATLNDKRYVDKDSFTLNFGANTTKTVDHLAMVRAIIATASKKWQPEDHVRIVGGIALLLEPLLQRYFPNAVAFHPMIRTGERVHPVYANAVGNYEIARRLYS